MPLKPDLTEAEMEVLAKVLNSNELQNEIGAENWDLTEEEEMVLWTIINASPHI